MISRSIDKAKIKGIINHPQVINWVTDDPFPTDYDPVIVPNIIYLVDETQEGVIRLDQVNSIMCGVHIATTPKMWGEGHTFVSEAISWVCANTMYQKAIAMIPAFNERTIKLVERAGFKKEGVLTKSFMKNWKLHDQIIYGLSKGDI
jgi:RimJ/RimL family protein N-acetyltransferase